MPNQIIGIDTGGEGTCVVKGTRMDDGTVVIEEVKFGEPEWWMGYVSKSDERMVNVLYIPDIIAEATRRAKHEAWEEAKIMVKNERYPLNHPDVILKSDLLNIINSRIQQYGKK